MPLNVGLPVSKLIAVSVSLAVTPAQGLNFNSMLIVGDSNVIDVGQRIRSYSTLGAIATDFGTTAPEYLGAKDFFGQNPQPNQLYIGRWAKTATSGLNVGGVLSATQQALSNWTVVTAGQFKVNIDGAGVTNVTCGTFAAQTSLNGVASVIQTALRAIGTGGFSLATCTWNSVYGQFTITSGTTGATSSVSALTAGTANDISAQLLMTASTLTRLVAGIAAETALQAVVILDGLTTTWYGLAFCTLNSNADLADSDSLAIAAYIEADANPHLYGLTTSEAAAIVAGDTTSIGAQLKALSYNRTGYQWSSTDPYAICALFGDLLTVNYLGSNTALIIAWKQEVGVTPETLTLSQSSALDANNYNYYANVNNNTSIIFNGTVASGHYWDEIAGTDWLANYIQTNLYNVFFTTSTKIPQTDAGMNTIAGSIEASCQQGVNNGLLAPGVWNSNGFGQLLQGQFLGNGYYVYAPPIASQTQSARALRQSVPIQVAAKLAGGVQSANVSIVVNQ